MYRARWLTIAVYRRQSSSSSHFYCGRRSLPFNFSWHCYKHDTSKTLLMSRFKLLAVYDNDDVDGDGDDVSCSTYIRVFGCRAGGGNAAAVEGQQQQQQQWALIERAVHSGVIVPGQDWHTITHEGHTATMRYKVRVKCDTYYYNTTCTKFCRPRNDKFGHHSCNDNGDKICMDGWIGPNCDIGKLRYACLYFHAGVKCVNKTMPWLEKHAYSHLWSFDVCWYTPQTFLGLQ